MVISRVMFRVTPFRALITLLITYLLSPLPLQVFRVKCHTAQILGFYSWGLRFRAFGSGL